VAAVVREVAVADVAPQVAAKAAVEPRLFCGNLRLLHGCA
jgi:hypothetical protein